MPIRRTNKKQRRATLRRRQGARKSKTSKKTAATSSSVHRRNRATQRKRVETRCKNVLRQQISKNMREWKRGRYVSQQQALAVSHSQIRKRYPSCRRMLTQRS